MEKFPLDLWNPDSFVHIEIILLSTLIKVLWEAFGELDRCREDVGVPS